MNNKYHEIIHRIGRKNDKVFDFRKWKTPLKIINRNVSYGTLEANKPAVAAVKRKSNCSVSVKGDRF